MVVAGEHDLSTAPRLEHALRKIERHGTDVIIDFSEATFVDSSWLRAMLAHSAKPSEAVVIVAPPATPPRRLFDLVQVGKAVRVCDSREDALRALGR
jgi:anti-anti-sigma regulatory factor